MDDKELALVAVRQNGLALQHVSSTLQADVEAASHGLCKALCKGGLHCREAEWLSHPMGKRRLEI